ncbi:MAG: hypothetical protein CMH60_04315 [Myxococcales bacterium]|nr:hypothetical protein [Myxococcales bacterium]
MDPDHHVSRRAVDGRTGRILGRRLVAFRCAAKCLMRQSSAEFRQLLFKAGRGAGLPLGLAEDLVTPICWLQVCGFPGDAEALNALTALDEGRTAHKFPDLTVLAHGTNGTGSRLSAIYLAAVGCDALQMGWPHQDEEIGFFEVDSSLLLAAALVLAHRRLKTGLSLRVETKSYVLSNTPGGEVRCVEKECRRESISVRSIADVQLGLAKDLTDSASGVLLLDSVKEEKYHHICETDGLCANPDSIHGLQSLADRLLVPESDRSLKFGAGAGIVDSD